MQVDAAEGQILAAIDAAGIAGNTLVIFTSDNGCSPTADIKNLESQGHYPSAQFRGCKSDIWDGGHRIPFIARWPGKIKPASQTAELTCLSDLIATVSDLIGDKLPDSAAEDSVSMLPALLDKPHRPLREAVIHHSIDGYFAIRKGNWKLELCAGSGGWSAPHEAQAIKDGLPGIQLYDMNTDEGEKHNVAADHPDTVKELSELLKKYVADGRSTPGGSAIKRRRHRRLQESPHPGRRECDAGDRRLSDISVSRGPAACRADRACRRRRGRARRAMDRPRTSSQTAPRNVQPVAAVGVRECRRLPTASRSS
jgi:arylsulfatase A-like enzyme